MKQAIIDLESGEILRTLERGDTIRTKKQNEYVKNSLKIRITQEMLDHPTKEFILSLYSKMKIYGEINKFGFIKMKGLYWNIEIFKIMKENNILSTEIADLLSRLSSRNFIKKDNGYTEVVDWNDLYEVLGIKHSVKKAKLRKILTKKDIVRLATRPNNKKVLVLNPNWIRLGSWVSDFALSVFKDCTLKKINYENVLLLFFNGLIEKHDIENI